MDNELKATPGPWEAAIEDVGLSGIFIANTTVSVGYANKPEDAHLVAAAPDLYDALLMALPYVETAEHDDGYKKGAVKKIVAQMTAALAKARGEASNG